ncbi:putative dead helicase superfamily protein [Phaeomoniella chlamydospora]|uniref:Pre-mRNA-splicing factor n=1 Tax=Phaeomoniella chlamydospora TaxID=158046 RepID=A0A0G2E580_PHACM|nr:putative dead helicase superfamily protein [Phaeomoniella chlamydospora]
MAPALETSPSAPDISRDGDKWSALADKLWLGSAKKPTAKDLKPKLWDILDADGFSSRALATLETLQILEKYLWPTYTEDASNFHVILIAAVVSVKQRVHLPIWELFLDRTNDFSSLFRRVLSMTLDPSLPANSRLFLLSFVTGAYQSLETGIIRKECAPLVSISIWHHLHSVEARERVLENNQSFRKAWRAAAKRYDAAEEETKARIRFERSWLYSMILDFIRQLSRLEDPSAEDLLYFERLLELLVDLNSQLPTRRYTHLLLKDLNLLPLLRLSGAYQQPKNGLFRDLVALLDHFLNFPLDEHGSSEHTSETIRQRHCASLGELQRAALKHFKAKLTVLALSNYSSIDQRSELESQLSVLEDEELVQLCQLLGIRTSFPKQVEVVPDRRYYLEVIISRFERPATFQDTVAQLSVLPAEGSLYDPALLRNENYDGSRPVAIPKLNLQYLSLGDFLWRSLVLHRAEAFFEIRKDLESAVKRMRPRMNRDGAVMTFEGFSKMGLPIARPAIIEVAPPKVSTSKPAFVRAEIMLDMSKLSESIRFEWEQLRPDEVVFLLSVGVNPQSIANGSKDRNDTVDWMIQQVRSAEVVQVQDENGRGLRTQQNGHSNGYTTRPRQRRLLVNLDSTAYDVDAEKAQQAKEIVYSSMNILVRRRGRENNFKQVLETMQRLTAAEARLPHWLQEVFLGYGDPTSAKWTQLDNKVPAMDFRDTFLDWAHLKESFPERGVEVEGTQTNPLSPPFILHLIEASSSSMTLNPPKKRRRDQAEVTAPTSSSIKVTTYRPPNTGPYPMDAPKLNTVRYTPSQVEAIMSGTQPGLSVIVGPPGTGKTDVATQIINLLYHNFPEERILLVAHSNQALNQLFQKITALDIDARHLLRLGHGEEDLETNVSYSKHGRVESFLENRAGYLAEVNRMAASLGVQGAHGNSCETADYFNQVYVQPAWAKYWDIVHADATTKGQVIESFPFHGYFANAPHPLFDDTSSKEDLIATAAGCQHHISRIFSELEDIRPFEILRQPRDKANYLLIKEARIIAMTSTHAAMRRQEIADLGFHYDTVVMEEAAQITEIESFIPCAMQRPHQITGELPLKRVVLCGDHLQNSPIVQNMAFRQYANLEQSLFLRLVRLGVPIITLDRQGRCRPSIAELFTWRYPFLGNLPAVQEKAEFLSANAGFCYDYQFIDVPDYQGIGEREPSPHFIQNLGEAEYAVAIYQYMRLLGYPADNISILATYAGQKALIQDVLQHRCKGNRLFGLPKIVTTVDKYQGEQNDYIILSLTRTRTVGYLRDVRRLTVALSRARLGLYILGRRELFESCYEMKPAMELLTARPGRLALATGEMFPAQRLVGADVENAAEMHGVEHLGQYVYEMTQAKIKALGGDVVVTSADGENTESYGANEDDVEAALDEADEEDPLHEQVEIA